MSEDEPLVWVERDCSRLAAIKAGADEMCISARGCWARKRYMREATKELDCPVWPHEIGEDGDPPDDCDCWRIEDGYWFQCAADAPGAFPVWRVYERAHRRWLRRRFIRLADKTIWRRRSYSGRKSVLWGGRVERRVTRLDRWFGCAGVLLLGDRWLRPEPIEWVYCDACRCKTPRHVNGKFRRCLAYRHGTRKFGAVA